MINPHLAALADYPFDRLRALLDGFSPPPDLTPMVLSVGEPRRLARYSAAGALLNEPHQQAA